MRLILVRHGETDWNKAKRMQGNSGAPLNPTGRAQARAIAEALAQDRPFTLYSSHAPRAMETAQIVAEAVHVPATPLGDLAEVDVGELEGLTGV